MTARRAARAILPALLVMTGSSVGIVSAPVTAWAHEQTTDVSLTLLQQTPWTTNETPQLRMSVVVTNSSGTTLEDLSIGLTVGPAIISRFQYEEALVEGPTSAAFATTFPYEGAMDPGTAATATFTLDVSTIDLFEVADSGVYPARVDVRDNGIVLAELNTALIHIVQEPESRVRFAWWVELTAPVAFAPDGRLEDPGFAASLAPGGALYEPVAALQRLAEAAPPEIDLVIEPSLLDQARRMVDGYERTTGQVVEEGTDGAAAAAVFLDMLRDVASIDEVQVSAMPFSGPSIPAMLRSGLAPELTRQRATGDRLIGEILDVNPADTVARPPGGLMDDATLDQLAFAGATAVLADAVGDVERPSQGDLEFAPAPTATITALGDRTVSLVLPDPAAQDLLERADLLVDPVRAAQAVLGELAVIWKEQPIPAPQPDGTPTVRGLALALPADLPPTIWTPLLRRLAVAPFLQPEHAQDFVTSVNPPGPAAILEAPDEGAFTTGYAEEIRALQRDIGAYESMLTEPSAEPGVLRRKVMYAEAAEFLVNEPAGRTWLASVAATTDTAFASTKPAVDQVFTFTSGEGTIPLRMGDPGEFPLEVAVQLSSSSFDFPEGNRQVVVLDQPNEIVAFEVVARGAGLNSIVVDVYAPSGRRISTQLVQVRSTALNRIALFVTIGAAVLLLALYGRRWGRRRKSPS
jgi:hypothetical protein